MATALMKTKSEKAYTYVFKAMLERCRALNLQVQMGRLLVDFEMAEMNAASDVFGKDKVH